MRRSPLAVHLHTQNAITNELFLTHAAQLALRYKQQGQQRRGGEGSRQTAATQTVRMADWAHKELSFILASGMINGSFLVNDGLDTFAAHPTVCLNNGHTAYSYNQGVILSGLAFAHQLGLGSPEEGSPSIPPHPTKNHGIRALSHTTSSKLDDPPSPLPPASSPPSKSPSSWAPPPSPSPPSPPPQPPKLITLATNIVNAVFTSNLVYAGTHILREMDEVVTVPLGNLYSGSPGTDGLQFKGVFLRHLRKFGDVVIGRTYYFVCCAPFYPLLSGTLLLVGGK
jgi:hypothetical protein